MRKKSSQSSRDGKPGPGNFKRNSESKPFSKSAKPFKKNYDGRSSSQGDGNRPSRPYSGRTTDGESVRRAPEDRPGRSDTDRKPRKEFDKDRRPSGDRPFDKPKRPYADKRGPFDKPVFERGDNKNRDERKPRSSEDKPFDKPRRPYADKRGGFDKPTFKKDDNKTGDDRKPRSSGDRSFDKPKRPYADKRGAFDKPTFKRDDKSNEDRKPRVASGDKPFEKSKRPFEDRRDPSEKPAFRKDENTEGYDKPRRPKDSRPFRDRPTPHPGKKSPFGKPSFEKKGKDKEKEEPKFDSVMKNAFNPPKKKADEKDAPLKPVIHEDKVFGELEEPVKEEKIKRMPVRKGASDAKEINNTFAKKKHVHDHSGGRKKKYIDEDEDDDTEVEKKSNFKPGSEELIPLNKYIAHSGECSRRDAAELVRQGKVKVNGELILEPGHKVRYDDNVTLVGKKLKPQKDNVYILLNKPKGFITTNEDPQGRKTVMELVQNSGADRLFPVGRLDRDTSGLLLITNDGDLTQKLCHPSFNIKKVYQVTLDKPLTKADFEKIVEGVELEDGKAIVDEIAYLEAKNELGLEIHSGRNRIVRRIFESLGYVVEKLDRMMYAGLTKKNLPRGKWRFLDQREIVLLKHFKS